MKNNHAIPNSAVLDAAKEALSAIYVVFDDFVPEKPIDRIDAEYHRKATAAALRAALVAIGED